VLHDAKVALFHFSYTDEKQVTPLMMMMRFICLPFLYYLLAVPLLFACRSSIICLPFLYLIEERQANNRETASK
jgi:hypothetical protein